jgi:Kdo2-lipid IVA lauroyltransferase/acyltransferase
VEQRPPRILERAEIVGLERLQAALAKGRGAILIGGHFTTIEIATRIISAVVPMSAVYRPAKNEVLARAMLASFSRTASDRLRRHPLDDSRAAKNGVVWYAPDQSYRNKGAAMVDFFGIPAATTTATSRLAQISGAAVLTYFPERLPGNAGYRVVIGEPFDNFPERRSGPRRRALRAPARGADSARSRSNILGSPPLQGS